MSIEVDVDYRGTETGAEQLDNLVEALDTVTTKQTGAATASERLERSVTSATTATTRLRASATQTAAAVQVVQTNMQQAAERGGQFASALGSAVSALGQGSQSAQIFGQGIGQVGQSLQQLLTATDPVSRGIAAVTLAVNVGATAWRLYESRLEQARQTAQRARETFGDTEEGQLRAQLAQAGARREELRGGGSAADFSQAEAAVRAFENRLREIREEQDRRYQEGARQRAAEEAERRLNEQNAQNLARVQSDESELSRQEALRREQEAAGREAAGRARQRAEDRHAMIIAQAEKERQSQEIIQREQDVANDNARFHEEQLRAIRDFRHDRELQVIEEEKQARLRAIDEEKEKRRGAEELLRQEAERTSEVVQSAVGLVASSYSDAFQSAIEGNKDFGAAFAQGTKRILKGLGDEMVGKGVMAIGEGVTMVVTNPPGAASKFAGGALLIAGGVALGAAGAAIPSGAAAASPERPRQNIDRGGGDGIHIVQNFGAPIVTAETRTQLGLTLRNPVDAAARRYGPNFQRAA